MNTSTSSNQQPDREVANGFAVLVSILDAALMLAALLTSDSNVIMSEFLKGLVEFVAVFLSWLTIRRLGRGGGLLYEFGLGKLENLASLAVGLLMVASLVILVYAAVRDLAFPQHISGAGVWLGAASVGVFGSLNLRVWWQSRRQARKGGSPLIASQARLFLTRALSDFFTLATLAVSLVLRDYAWAAYIDPAASLLIAVAIMLTAWGIFSGSLKDLLDRTLDEEYQLAILRELAQHFEDYRDLRGIRTRRAGRHSFIEIALEFDPEWRVGRAQEVAARLVGHIQAALPNSVVTIALAPSAAPLPPEAPAGPLAQT